MKIKFGPAGIGSVKDVEHSFEELRALGIRAAEIPFTYGIFIKDKKTAERVKTASEKFGIQLSIHAPYWINLNSAEKEKVEASKQRLLKCLEIGTWLGAKVVVFHPGYYGKDEKEKTFYKIKQEILELQKIREKKKFAPELAVETTGKKNVFGSLEEIQRLVEETNCRFCIDFAHVLARYKTCNFDEVKKLFGKYQNWHCHFSGIEYGDKGEKRHVQSETRDWKKLLKNLPKNKNITIISEDPSPVEGSLKGLEIWKG